MHGDLGQIEFVVRPGRQLGQTLQQRQGAMGGFLGFGGVKVSEKETAAIAQITAALG